MRPSLPLVVALLSCCASHRALAASGQPLPSAEIVAEGGTAAFSVPAVRGTTYQWQLDGVAISGATDATLFIASVSSANQGGYSCAATSAAGTTTTAVGSLTIGSGSPGYLVNLAARASVGSASNDSLIVGFSTTGQPKPYLIRAVGPTLANFGLANALAAPVLTLFSGQTVLASNAGWQNDAALRAAFNATGAFPLPATSVDASVLESLGDVGGGSRGYTAQVGGSSSSAGVAIAEIYDDGASSAPGQRLINVSSRALVKTGSDILIDGFAVAGSNAVTVLIRAVGPTLATFGVTGVLEQPQLTVYRNNSDGTATLIASNSGWNGDATLAKVFQRVGAFGLPANSADAALLITLPPGLYTAQVSGVNGTSGVALAEVYDVWSGTATNPNPGNKPAPTITWNTPVPVTLGAALGTTQLNATASYGGASVPGTFTYTPGAGTVMNSDGPQMLSVTFTPTDTANYAPAYATVSLNVARGTPSYAFRNVKILAGGYIPGVYFHPTQRNLMYARTDIGGIYRWGPKDTQWVPLLDWLTDGFFNGADAIGLDPTDPNKLYVAAGLYSDWWAQNGEMLISSDQGATFKTVPLGFKVGSNNPARGMGDRIAVDPNLPGTVYFGTRQNGLQISTNSGDGWTQITGLNVVTAVPNNSNGGTYPTGVVSVLPIKSSGSPGSATPVVYAAVGGTGLNGNSQSLYVTTNGGSTASTWTAVAGQPSFATAAKPLAPMQAKLGPNGALYIIYGDATGPDSGSVAQLWKFTPGSNWTSGTWTQIALPANAGGPPDQQGYCSVAVDPSHPGTIMVGSLNQYWPTGDVVYRSTDDGATWRDVTTQKTPGNSSSRSPNLATHSNLNAPYFGAPGTVSTGNWNTGLAIDPFNPDHAIYTFGGGLWITHDLTHADPSATSRGVVDWFFEDEGIEETAVNILLAPPSGNTILLSGIGDVHGFAHTDLTVSPAQGNYQVQQATPTSMDFVQNLPLTVVRVTDGTYGASPVGVISTDGGMTWSGFAATPTGSKGGGAIAIAADGSSIVWATQDTSSVWYSKDGGKTWAASTGIQAQSQVVGDRAKAGVYYGYNGSTGTLTLSTDGGVTFTTVQTGLPVAAQFTATPTLVSLPDAQGNLWLTAGGNGTGLYTNTGSAASPKLTTVTGVQKSTSLGYGRAAPGSSKLTLFLAGTIGSKVGLYRSTDGGASWIQINDDAHQYGGIGPVCGDMRTFGTVYFTGSGRGILWGTSAN